MSTITCKISGETLVRSDLLLGFDLLAVHPIFRAKKELILHPDTVHKFRRAAIWPEKKLYFLAVLNTLELIEFKVPANPSPYTMETNFLQAVHLAGWIDYARHEVKKDVAFPRYTVSIENDTQTMQNIQVWLEELQEIRNYFLKQQQDLDARKRFNDKAAQIEKEFRIAHIFGQAFTPDLAKWALEVSDCPPGLYHKYKEALTTPLEEAWCLDQDFMEEIYEFLSEELPATHDQCIAVKTQARKLWEASKQGYRTFGKSDGTQVVKPNGVVYQIDDDGTAMPTAGNLPPLGPQPQPHQFAKYTQYLLAKAQWEIERDKRKGPSGEYRQF